MPRSVSLHLELSGAENVDLRISRVRGHEAMSQLYAYEVELWGPSHQPLDTDDLIGSTGTLVIEQEHQEVRRVHGMLERIDRLYGGGDDHHRYRVRLVPHAHLLQLIETLDVFTGERTAKDIIELKLEQCGVDCDMTQLVSPLPRRDFFVQYEETNWQFVCRHAEHVGLSFCFAQQGTDTMLFFDDTTHLPRELSMEMTRGFGDVGVTSLEVRTATTPSLHVVMDYNEETPEIDLTCTDESDLGFAGGVVENGPHYRTVAEGERFARVRREASDCRRRQWRGTSNVLSLAAGQRITIDLPEGPLDLFLERVDLEVDLPEADDDGDTSLHQVHFVALDATLPYRPPRRTPVPRVDGLLSAIVEPQSYGEVGDYAHLDSAGRYMVKFRFDSAELDGHASCPVRMVQQTAGPHYGMHFPLKPGVEVAVGFLHGDPDRPVIVGSLHNATTPALVRDQNATTSMIKTRSGINIKMKDA